MPERPGTNGWSCQDRRTSVPVASQDIISIRETEVQDNRVATHLPDVIERHPELTSSGRSHNNREVWRMACLGMRHHPSHTTETLAGTADDHHALNDGASFRLQRWCVHHPKAPPA